jgi:serine/threonine-protein kinase
MDSLSAPRPLLRTTFDERAIAISPDGHYLAYVSNETGGDEVYVRRLTESSSRWRVSTGGGTEPRWSIGGRELLFRANDSLYVTPMTLGAEVQVGRPRALFAAPFVTDENSATWDVTADGRRFVFIRGQQVESDRTLTVILHWFDQLRAQRR